MPRFGCALALKILKIGASVSSEDARKRLPKGYHEVLNGLIYISDPSLIDFAVSPGGSRLLESACHLFSQTQRAELVKRLKGSFATLITSRDGSWVVEKLFASIDYSVAMRTAICEELAAKNESIRGAGGPWTLKALQQCMVDSFRSRRSHWDQVMKDAAKRSTISGNIADRVDSFLGLSRKTTSAK